MKNSKKVLYSLKCDYYQKEFNSLNDLIENIVISGQDPSYEITKNGKGIGEEATDFIVA